MAEKQSPEDKAAAFREYRQQQQSIMDRTATLRFERLQREAAASLELEQPALPRRRPPRRDR